MFSFTLGGAFLEILAFVLEFLARPDAELHLDQRPLEIDAQRNDRFATRLDLDLEAIQFASMEKKLARATRFVIFQSTELILADVGVKQKQFVLNELGESLSELDFPVPNGLDLGSLEGNPSLVFVGYEVLAASLRITDFPHPLRVFGFLGHSIGGSLVRVVG